MPFLEPQNISISTRDGDLPAAFFVASSQAEASDDSPPSSRGILVVIHDINGMDETAHDACARLSQMGYSVLAPDLFALGGGPKEDTEAALADHAATLSDARVVAAILSSLDAATQSRDMSTHAGVIGWGWGGAYALMAAAHDARFRVAADIGGVISYPVTTPAKPGSPLNFVANVEGALFAAFPGNDPDFPDFEIERMKSRLVEHDKRGEVRVYTDAPAKFWRAADSLQTQALWRRLECFLEEHIDDCAADEFVSPSEYLDERPDAGHANEASRLHA